MNRYDSELKSFTEWCAQREQAMPPPIEVAGLYLTESAAHLAVKSARVRAWALQRFYTEAGVPLACNCGCPHCDGPWNSYVRAALEVAGEGVGGKRRLSDDELAAMVRPLDRTTAAGARDRCILTLTFALALLRSEVVAIDRSTIPPISPLTETVSIGQHGRIRRNRARPDLCPVESLRRWSEMIPSGPLFRAVTKHDTIGERRLSDRGVALVVKRAAERVGIDPDDVAGNSLRGQ